MKKLESKYDPKGEFHHNYVTFSLQKYELSSNFENRCVYKLLLCDYFLMVNAVFFRVGNLLSIATTIRLVLHTAYRLHTGQVNKQKNCFGLL